MLGKCEDCAFFFRNKEDVHGTCRFGPPEAVSRELNEPPGFFTRTFWPELYPDDAPCGKFLSESEHLEQRAFVQTWKEKVGEILDQVAPPVFCNPPAVPGPMLQDDNFQNEIDCIVDDVSCQIAQMVALKIRDLKTELENTKGGDADGAGVSDFPFPGPIEAPAPEPSPLIHMAYYAVLLRASGDAKDVIELNMKITERQLEDANKNLELRGSDLRFEFTDGK